MKPKYTKLFLVLGLIIGLEQTHGQQDNKSQIEFLTKYNWTSIVMEDSCLESLSFRKDSTLNFYSCEIGWDYEGVYSITGDSLMIGINMTQDEVNHYDRYDFTTKWILRIKSTELEWLKIENKNGQVFNEVEKEIYDRLKNFKK